MLKTVFIGLLLFFSLKNVYAIKISTDNTGQLLLAPIYLADKDVETKLTIINTRVDAAVVAKLVLRDFNVSAKLLEINLYLSPGDMWTGILYGGHNQTKIFSSDDSVINQNFVFATPDDPMNLELLHGTTASGINNIGHIEVTGMASLQTGHRYCKTAGKLFPAKGETQCQSVLVQQGMSKEDLLQLAAYAADITSLREDSQGNKVYLDIDSDGGGISSVEPEKMQMSGMAEISSPTGLQLNYSMTALKSSNYHWGNAGIDIKTNLPVPKTGSAACKGANTHTCFPNHVISNPLFANSQIAKDGIGESYGTGNADLSFAGDTSDHVIAIESLLAKTEIKHTYIKGKTILLTTFPTKYRHLSQPGEGVCRAFYGTPDSDNTSGASYTSPFFQDPNGSLYFSLTSFNQQEKSAFEPGPDIPAPPDYSFSGGQIPETPPIPPNEKVIKPEIWITSLDKYYAFDKGWAALKFIYNKGCGYPGVPFISYTVRAEEKNLLLEKTF